MNAKITLFLATILLQSTALGIVSDDARMGALGRAPAATTQAAPAQGEQKIAQHGRSGARKSLAATGILELHFRYKREKVAL